MKRNENRGPKCFPVTSYFIEEQEEEEEKYKGIRERGGGDEEENSTEMWDKEINQLLTPQDWAMSV